MTRQRMVRTTGGACRRLGDDGAVRPAEARRKKEQGVEEQGRPELEGTAGAGSRGGGRGGLLGGERSRPRCGAAARGGTGGGRRPMRGAGEEAAVEVGWSTTGRSCRPVDGEARDEGGRGLEKGRWRRGRGGRGRRGSTGGSAGEGDTRRRGKEEGEWSKGREEGADRRREGWPTAGRQQPELVGDGAHGVEEHARCGRGKRNEEKKKKKKEKGEGPEGKAQGPFCEVEGLGSKKEKEE